MRREPAEEKSAAWHLAFPTPVVPTRGLLRALLPAGLCPPALEGLSTLGLCVPTAPCQAMPFTASWLPERTTARLNRLLTERRRITNQGIFSTALVLKGNSNKIPFIIISSFWIFL